MRGSLGPGETGGNSGVVVVGGVPGSVLPGRGGCSGRVGLGWVGSCRRDLSLSRLGRALLPGPAAAGAAPGVGQFPGIGTEAAATRGIGVSELPTAPEQVRSWAGESPTHILLWGKLRHGQVSASPALPSSAGAALGVPGCSLCPGWA